MLESLRLFTVDGPDVERVSEFYDANYDWHLMPRGPKDLRKIVERYDAYALEDEAMKVVAVAYVKGEDDDASPEEQDAYEFGGILFHESVRKRALGGESIAFPFCALVLGTCITGSLGKVERLVAHTHIANSRPHTLLEDLGFSPSGKVACLPGKKHPEMRASIDGNIWGVERLYQTPWLAKEIVGVFENWNGTLCGVRTEIDLWERDLDEEDDDDVWDPKQVASLLHQLAAQG